MLFPMTTKVKKSLFILALISVSCSDFGDSPLRGPDPGSPITSDIQAACSPDGKWIVYRHEDYSLQDTSYPTGLYIIDSSGNNRRQLIRGEARTPRWSPDANWIAFSAGRIYLVKPNGDSLTAVTTFSGFFPTWSPTGDRIACGRSGPQDTVGIWIIDLTSRMATRFGYGGDPDWSPDGTMFLYGAAVDPYRTGVVTVRVTDPFERRILIQSGDDHRNPRWRGDGTQIAWWISTEEARLEVWLMNADGSAKRRLTDGFYVGWKPPYDEVVCSRQSGSRVLLWAIRVDGSNRRQLTH